MEKDVSARGVYYNQYETPHIYVKYGYEFPFSSEAKKRSFVRKLNIELSKLDTLLWKLNKLTSRVYQDTHNMTRVKAHMAVKLFEEVEPSWHAIKQR